MTQVTRTAVIRVSAMVFGLARLPLAPSIWAVRSGHLHRVAFPVAWSTTDPFFHQRMATAMVAFATLTPTVLMLSEPQSAAVRDLLAGHGKMSDEE